jgi:ABC-type multidrug transport system ATPase subunit
MTGPVLRCEGLSASYGAHPVLTSASLSLPEGLFALQGANGIGKSTLLRLLAGAQPADGGEVWIDGISLMRSPLAARRRLSYVPDDSPVYPFMTGIELLRFVALAKRNTLDAVIGQMVREFDLSSQLDVRFDAMSLGTRKKVLLCAAWIGTPRVILMDEPSNGLDRQSRDHLIERLCSWGNNGTVLFATHDTNMVVTTNASVVTLYLNQRVANKVQFYCS